jgi:3-isopropylmalate/(R)-2-methylmalate dehydratase small subunit
MSLVVRGKVWKFGDDVSTDFMAPGFSRHQGRGPRDEAMFCMRSNRPGWTEKVRKGEIIVGGSNFGCGSSRMEAPKNLITLGISGIVAESFGRIFYRNCIASGLPVLMYKGVSNHFEEGDIAEVDYRKGLVTNCRTGKQLIASMLPDVALKMLEAGGIIPLLKKEYQSRPHAES